MAPLMHAPAIRTPAYGVARRKPSSVRMVTRKGEESTRGFFTSSKHPGVPGSNAALYRPLKSAMRPAWISSQAHCSAEVHAFGIRGLHNTKRSDKPGPDTGSLRRIGPRPSPVIQPRAPTPCRKLLIRQAQGRTMPRPPVVRLDSSSAAPNVTSPVLSGGELARPAAPSFGPWVQFPASPRSRV